MARIRSIHPGQWTDEDFVQMSPCARLLAISIRNECDDHGVFEWKPLRIKMRLFPADAVQVSALLAEMEAANQVQRFTVDGREYGAVRNFCLYQRTKKPSYFAPLPDQLRTYVGLSGAVSEPVPNQDELNGDQFRTGSELSPQKEGREEGRKGGREEGRKGGREEGRKEEGGAAPLAPAAPDAPPLSPSVSDEIEPEDGFLPLKFDRTAEGEAVKLWNSTAERIGLPTCQKFSPSRRVKLRKRLADCGGIEGWKAALAKVEASPFLTGDNPRGWRADFDFLMQEKSFTRLMEGGYDDRKPTGNGAGPNASGPAAHRKAILDGLADELGTRDPAAAGRH